MLIATQVPLESFHAPTDTEVVFTPVTLERMRPKDSALLLLELCERELTHEELSVKYMGYSPEVRAALSNMGVPVGEERLDLEEPFEPVEALLHHPILKLLDGMPVVVRWCAQRLSSGSVTLDRLTSELQRLSRSELVRLVENKTNTKELRGAVAPTGFDPRHPDAPYLHRAASRARYCSCDGTADPATAATVGSAAAATVGGGGQGIQQSARSPAMPRRSASGRGERPSSGGQGGPGGGARGARHTPRDASEGESGAPAGSRRGSCSENGGAAAGEDAGGGGGERLGLLLQQLEAISAQVAAEAAGGGSTPPAAEAAVRSALGRLQDALEPGSGGASSTPQGRPQLPRARGRHGSGDALGRRERKQNWHDEMLDQQRLDDHLLHDPYYENEEER